MNTIKITPEMVRDTLHNLDSNNANHDAIFQRAMYRYFVDAEGISKFAYDDARTYGRNAVSCINTVLGNVTVGIGFNMDDPASKAYWEGYFEGSRDFMRVYRGEENLNIEEINGLFYYVLDSKRKYLEVLYQKIFHKLKLNERLVLEDLYYHGPSMVGQNTAFYKYLHLYYETGSKEYIDRVIHEVRHRSNPTKCRGIQRRRDIQATVLDSTKAPFYSGPFDPLLPKKTILATIGETIIPRGTEDWSKPESSEYFIWRTQCDAKVR
jgi:hypothetical protein